MSVSGETSELREIAAAIYKLGVVAAELGLTGQESADTLKTAVRRLKEAAGQSDVPNSRHRSWTAWDRGSSAAVLAESRAIEELLMLHPGAVYHSKVRWESAIGIHGRVTVTLPPS